MLRKTFTKVLQKQKFSSLGRIVASKGIEEQLKHRLPLTKIVATIGPASENLPVLSDIVNAGMRIMRINFSHATYDEANLRVTNLNKCFGVNNQNGELISGKANMRGVMLDTQGPEIRTGSFADGVKEMDLDRGTKVLLTNDPSVKNSQDGHTIWVSYAKLMQQVPVGAVVLLDDGAIQVKVEEITSSSLKCEVIHGGSLGNKKGVNLPGLAVDLPAMSEKDKEDLKWGIDNNVDYIAASFVRKAKDVTDIRSYAASLIESKGKPGQMVPLIISKIESTEALDNFDSILEASDAIMVARGDLAVEIPMETLAYVQKEIVKRCNDVGKPVIVATQMLESMQKNPRPTRAECTDVANAILDGADCVMLSGESAKGKFPVETVGLMKRIVDQSELSVLFAEGHGGHLINPLGPNSTQAINKWDAMARAAVQVSHDIAPGYPLGNTPGSSKPGLSGIVVLAQDGEDWAKMAMAVGRQRPHVPVLCMVKSHQQGRFLQLNRGLHPILQPSESSQAALIKHIVKLGLAAPGEKLLIVDPSTGPSVTLCEVPKIV